MTRREELVELVMVLANAVADAAAEVGRLKKRLAAAEDELAERDDE